MEILNKEGDQNMSNGFLTLEQLQQYSIQEIGENVIGEFENVKEQFGKFFKESQDMKNNKYDLLRQESILLQFHKKQKNDKKIYNHEEIVDFLSGFKISIPQNTIAKEKKQIQSHFDIENLTEQKIFGRIIQNLDYKNKSIYNVSTDEREEFQELKNIFMNHLGIKNNKRSKRKQLKEFEKISEKYNKKFLEEMKLDYEVVDIGQKILDSLQDIRNEQKRVKLEDLVLLQYMFYNSYSILLYQSRFAKKYSDKTFCNNKWMYYITFLLGYAFQFSQKRQQIEDLMNAEIGSGSLQQEQSQQEQDLKHSYFKYMSKFVNENQNNLTGVQNILQYEMMANEQLFQHINQMRQDDQQNNVNFEIKKQIDYYLLGLNLIQQQYDGLNQMRTEENKDFQLKPILQELIYLQYYLANAIHYLNTKYLEQDGFMNRFQTDAQNLKCKKTSNFSKFFKNQQMKMGVFVEIIKQRNGKKKLLPVVVPYLRIGEQGEDFDYTPNHQNQSQNIDQDQKSDNLEKYQKFNMIRIQKIYIEESVLQNKQLNMRNNIFGVQYKFKDIMDNIEKGKQLVLPTNLNFTYGGHFFNIFWKNILTTIHGYMLEPQIYLVQNFCKAIKNKQQQQQLNMGGDSNEEQYNQLRKLQNIMLYEKAKFFIYQCKVSKCGDVQIFSLIIKCLLKRYEIINRNQAQFKNQPYVQHCQHLFRHIQNIQKRMNSVFQNDIQIQINIQNQQYEIKFAQSMLFIQNYVIKKYQTRDLNQLNCQLFQFIEFYGPQQYLGLELEKKQREEYIKKNQQEEELNPKNDQENQDDDDEIPGDQNSNSIPINKKIKKAKKTYKRPNTKNKNSVNNSQINVMNQNNNVEQQEIQIQSNANVIPQPQQQQQNQQQQPQNLLNTNFGYMTLDIAPNREQQRWVYEIYFSQNIEFQQQQQEKFSRSALQDQEMDYQHEEPQQIQFQQIQQSEQNNNQALQMEEEQYEEEEKHEFQYYNFNSDLNTQFIYGTPNNFENNYQNQALTLYQDRTTNYNNDLQYQQQQQNNLCISQFEFDPLNFFDDDNKYNN